MGHLADSILLGSSFLLTFLIFYNPNQVNKSATPWFGSFMCCIFLIVLENFLVSTGAFREQDQLMEYLNLSSFIIAQLFFLSISYYVEPSKRWKNTEYLHFGPAFIILILLLGTSMFQIQPAEEDISGQGLEKAGVVVNIIFSTQVIAYCLLTYRKLTRHQKNILQLNSSLKHIDLKWLQHISAGIILMAFFWIADILFNLSDTHQTFDHLTSILYLTGILYIACHWFRQKDIFPYSIPEKEQLAAFINDQSATSTASPKKLMSDERLTELKSSLEDLMQNQKPFLDDELNLVKLAGQLNITSHLLSYVINKGFSENFYQFINRYRIEEAKKLLLDPKLGHLSLLGIGFEVGFNSKTVFNTTFKKFTSLTPSEYKRQKTGTDL